MTRVLVALDDSPQAMRAARTAVDLFPDGEFLVINVAETPIPWLGLDGTGIAGALPAAQWDEMLRTEEAAARDEATELAAQAHVPVAEVIVESGNPAQAICAAAEEHDVDVIVVGSHDRGLFSRLVSPSVAVGVVHGTSRPVLVVSGDAPDSD